MWKWFRRNKDDGAFDPRTLGAPWGDRPSIYEFVRTHQDRLTGCLSNSAQDLPDEASRSSGRVRFAAGAMDGLFTHGTGSSDAEAVAKVVCRHLVRVVEDRDLKAFNILHAYLVEHPALGYLDRLNPLLMKVDGRRSDDVAEVGRYMLLHAADREVVKFAINLIGVFGEREDHPALLDIGSHDEFTLFAVVALAHSGGETLATWEMAKRVIGWGRVQCIERLDREIDDPAIKRWLLTEGYRTSIMVEYNAAICARRGELFESLERPFVERDLLDGAAEILAALARGNPGEGMVGYVHSARACERFLSILLEHESPSFHWLLAGDDIRRYAMSQTSGEKREDGWSVDDYAHCIATMKRICSRPVWETLVSEGLNSNVDFQFNCAAKAAELIGIDPWEIRFRQLQNGKDQWFWLLETHDESRVDRILQYAKQHIDLQRVATGYGDEIGLGQGFEEHNKLGWILQALRRWPGRGGEFIRAGLSSPVPRNRFGAVRAALRWAHHQSSELTGTAEALLRVEENEELKRHLIKLLAGEVETPDSEDPW